MLYMFKTNLVVEPKTFRIIRITTATIVVALYLSYISFLCFQIWTDKQVIQVANEKLSAIEVPNIEICVYGNDIKITQCVFTIKDRSKIHPSCARAHDDVSFLYRKPVVDKSHCFVFIGNRTLFFSEDNDDGVHEIVVVYFEILDLTGG
ncbi:13621_t:CDS:2 [Ambispora gerdemannii]|uniref:13621_t:CDS:1 n=1 Tax=Ambispora gerdemannii TaxID=144530 RepID=A0A9N9GBV7_9GLOM|nr:13621_t:CDS:2 [Ambispora gerdemannii]